MGTKRLFVTGLLLCVLGSCSDYNMGLQRPKGRIAVGQTITPPLIDYGSAAYQQKSILPVYTFIRKSGGTASSLDSESISLDASSGRPNISQIVAAHGNPGKPDKMTLVGRSIAEIQARNASDGCGQRLNDLADILKQYRGAVIICDNFLADALQNATEVNVDGRTFTSWSRSSFDYDSARVVIHEF